MTPIIPNYSKSAGSVHPSFDAERNPIFLKNQISFGIKMG
jgi:hypothetical protein